MALTVTARRGLDELADLAPAWDALADDAGAPLFSRPFWCLPWSRHLDQGEPYVLVAHDGPDLVGVAPLSRRRIGPIELVRFLGHGLGTVSAVVHHPDRRDAHDEIWASIVTGRGRFAQLLELRPPADEPVVPADVDAEVAPRDTCLVVRCDASWDDYLRARPKKLRENLRRAARALEGSGERHEVELVTTAAGWTANREAVIDVFDRAEAVQPRHHMFEGSLGPFMDDFLTDAAREGRLRLFVGRVGGRPVSFGIAFAAAGTLSYWITRFDPAYAHASVGVLLLAHIVQHGFTEGYDAVDLLLGDQGHKRRWATDDYPTLTVHAGSSRPVLATGDAVLRAAAALRR